MPRSARLLLLLALTGGALGCHRADGELPPDAATTAAPQATGTSSARIVRAAAGANAAEVIREARDQATRDGRELVVYVGAKWCEPCRYIHKATQAGELDAAFPRLTLLEFDLDEDRDRLKDAGYVAKYIPLFVVPEADGRPSERRFEGSAKGPLAVAYITPRLRTLLQP